MFTYGGFVKLLKVFWLAVAFLLFSSCKSTHIRNFENERAIIFQEVFSVYLEENPEFMEFQEDHNLSSIYLSKSYLLNSSMFDIGIPMKTIPLEFRKSLIPKEINGIKLNLITDEKISRLEKKRNNFQYLFISELYYNDTKIFFEIRRCVFSNKKKEYDTKVIELERSTI